MNPSLKWLLQRLQQELCLEPGNLEHLRARLRGGKAGFCESHWFLLEGLSNHQLQKTKALMQEFQRLFLQVERGESWSLDAWNQGLLVPLYQVTLQIHFCSNLLRQPMKVAPAEAAIPV